MPKVTSIVNESKKSGEKNGKRWNIMTVEVDKDGEKVIADSFDRLEVGAEVFVTYNADYKSYNAKLASSGGGKTNAKLDEMDKKLDKIIAILDERTLDVPEFE